MKYLILDTNNLLCRHAFLKSDLKNNENIPTNIHFGVFNSLISLKKKFPDFIFLMSFDGHSERRIKEAKDGVRNGIIPDGYKENRKKQPLPAPLKILYEQMPFIRRGLGQLGISQIQIENMESDDVIASYSKLLRDNNEIVVVTSDKDYYSLLHKNVSIWDDMKKKNIGKDDFVKEYLIEPELWTDVGALMGDDGDNIHGVPGIGLVTALKEIKKYGNIQNLLEEYKKKYNNLRLKYPDLKGPLLIKDGYDTKVIFEELKNKKSDKGKFIYPEINFDMPYSGVLNAFDKNLIKIPKYEIFILMFESRIFLSKSLKKMDEDIPNLPEINKFPFNKDRLLEYFRYYDITTLDESICIFE